MTEGAQTICTVGANESLITENVLCQSVGSALVTQTATVFEPFWKLAAGTTDESGESASAVPLMTAVPDQHAAEGQA